MVLGMPTNPALEAEPTANLYRPQAAHPVTLPQFIACGEST